MTNVKTVELFERLAAWVWTTIALSAEEGISCGEQTLTEQLLLEIKRARLPNVRVRQYPPDLANPGAILGENVTGLDWEWWIGSPRRHWLRFAVQAKKLDLDSQRYQTLNHVVGTMAQNEILARYAEANDAIPLYCFYNHVRSLDPGRSWQCGIEAGRPEQLGCTVTPLSAVQKALRKHGSRTFDYFHSQPCTLPWRCLVRCGSIRSVIDEHWGGSKPKDHLPPDIETLRTSFRGEDTHRAAQDHQEGDEIRPRRVLVVDLGDHEGRTPETPPIPPLKRYCD
jgi:hypothetical protein